jgi:hypothetical protein
MVRNNPGNGMITMCPASKHVFRNIFSFKSNIDDEFDIPDGVLENISKHDDKVTISTGGKISLFNSRRTSYEGYANVTYNMSWLLFADEPVEARFTAPFYPASSPIEGALLSGGQFDIGKWFRPFNMDFHVPFNAKKVSFKEGQPLFFLEIMTNKKVEFKRFKLSTRLHQMSREMGTAPNRYGKFKTLAQRYESAKKAQIPEIILSEIKDNLI